MKNNSSVICAAIITLIILNCVDDYKIDQIAAFFNTVGEGLVLGNTSCYSKLCNRNYGYNCTKCYH